MGNCNLLSHCYINLQSKIRNRNPLLHALCSPILNSAIVDLCSMRYALCNFNPNSKIQNLKSNNPPSAFRLPTSGHGQSFEGLKNDPLVSAANFQNALAANGSPSIGYKMILTGTPAGS